MLPTGSVTDPITVGGRDYRGTFVSAGAPAALFAATDFGLTGAEDNATIAAQLPLLVELRSEAALRMGLRKPGEPVAHAVPKVGVVGAPHDYRTSSGVEMDPADEYDVSVRMVSMLAPHPAIGLTSAVAVAAAATLPGGVVADDTRTAWPGSLRSARPPVLSMSTSPPPPTDIPTRSHCTGPPDESPPPKCSSPHRRPHWPDSRDKTESPRLTRAQKSSGRQLFSTPIAQDHPNH